MNRTQSSRRRALAAAVVGLALVAAAAPVGAVTEEAKLTAADAAAGDRFGRSVSVSGDTAVVGSYLDDDAGLESGSAYVFTRTGVSWTQQAKLTASDAAAGDAFGISVSVSGDTAVVGAYFDDDGGSASGSAYVFVRSGSTWTQQAKLTASDAAAGDEFGFSVSVSGDTAVVGSHRDDDADPDAGSAYVFTRSGSTWTEQAKLTASDAAAFDEFGFSVSVSGDTAVVGSHRDDDADPDAGSAYVFSRSGSTWTEEAKLTAADAAAADFFGVSVSVSGDTAVVGSLSDDAGTASGSAYVFSRSGSTWTEEAKLTASDAAEGDRFGFSVSVYGDTAVVGSYLDDDGGLNSGSAYVFSRSGSTWTEQAKLTASDAAEDDRFGVSVSVSGDTAVVGSWLDDDAGSDSGSAYVWPIDTTGPQTEFDTADGDVVADVAGALVVPVRGQVADALSTVVSVEVTFTAQIPGASDVTVSASLDCDPTGRSCTWTAEPPRATGIYEVTAQGTDALGNVGDMAGPVTVVVVGAG